MISSLRIGQQPSNLKSRPQIGSIWEFLQIEAFLAPRINLLTFFELLRENSTIIAIFNLQFSKHTDVLNQIFPFAGIQFDKETVPELARVQQTCCKYIYIMKQIFFKN